MAPPTVARATPGVAVAEQDVEGAASRVGTCRWRRRRCPTASATVVQYAPNQHELLIAGDERRADALGGVDWRAVVRGVSVYAVFTCHEAPFLRVGAAGRRASLGGHPGADCV